MSKLNKKYIFNWVNSHIADYPKLLFLFRFISDLTTITKVAIFVSFVSLYLLFFVSTILGILWLFFFTMYLLYNKKYKIIFSIWGNFLFIWYLVFIVCLVGYDGAILIAPGFFDNGPIHITPDYLDGGNGDYETSYLFLFISERYLDVNSTENYNKLYVGNFCMETFYILCCISSYLKVTIYLPSLLKGILALFKFIRGR